MIAAGHAAESGAQVALLEKTDRPGNKILISGKSRCNLTNIADINHFIALYGSNGRFLFSAFSQYFRDDILAFLKRYGVETSTERDGRIFPSSDDARDVVNVFRCYLDDNNVQTHYCVNVKKIVTDKGFVIGVQSDSKTYPARSAILATGGASYPTTGSSGDGYRIAGDLGHTIIPIRPSLVPLSVVEKELARSMQGVSLRNVRLTAFKCAADAIDLSSIPTRDSGRGIPGRHSPALVIESRRGDMIITHFGLSGPVVLQMSLAIVDALKQSPVAASIDLYPELSVDKLREHLQLCFEYHGKKSVPSMLKILLPQKLIQPFIEITEIDPDKRCHQISSAERERLLNSLKSLRFTIKDALRLAEAMVTAGGVSLKEIDPRTMGSRLVNGLYFCGEVMDIDAETGGYNLQAAFSTGYVAGEHAAKFVTRLSH